MALNRIFGQYGNSDTALFVLSLSDLVYSLYLISSSEKFNKNTRSDFLTLLNSLTKFLDYNNNQYLLKNISNNHSSIQLFTNI